MRKVLSLAGSSALFVLTPVVAFAQAAVDTVTAVGTAAVTVPIAPIPIPPELLNDPNAQFLQMLWQSLGGLNGASTLAIVGVVVKLLIKALDLPVVATKMSKAFKDWNSGTKLTFVLGLSYVSGVVGLMSPPNSLPWNVAMVHSSVLAAFVVLSNQMYKHWLQPATPTEQK